MRNLNLASNHPFHRLQLSEYQNFLQVKTTDSVSLDLKYATNDNFMKENLYLGFQDTYLHRDAHAKFQKAEQLLNHHYPELSFVVFDCLRPQSITQKMWDFLSGKPEQIYVANPKLGSLHNFGMALDLSVKKKSGALLDMGTEFDDFAELAQPKMEEQFIKSGQLSQTQLANRMILRNIMHEAGFEVLPFEWWHFNAAQGKTVRENYLIFP